MIKGRVNAEKMYISFLATLRSVPPILKFKSRFRTMFAPTHFSTSLTIFASIILGFVSSAEYQARLQPELDSINLNSYLKNERNVKLQFKCLLDDNAPCDIVGRWLKPRVAKGLLGQCIRCTPKQEGYIETVTAFVQDKHPQVFRALLTKYVTTLGIQVPPGNDNDQLNYLQETDDNLSNSDTKSSLKSATKKEDQVEDLDVQSQDQTTTERSFPESTTLQQDKTLFDDQSTGVY